MAFAGFSPGEAEGLRRAMSRKRSAAAIEAYHQRFVDGAMARFDDVDAPLAERVWTMIVGFSGFGFPKAHGAAFGLLAYQSTWLRVHYGPEFLCALLDEQPMGFYPPDALVHEAQRRGIEILPPDVNASEVGCTVTPEGAVRLGLGYVLGRARRRGRRARRRARRRRPVRVARRSRLARRRGPAGARPAGVVGRVRCPRGASTPRVRRRPVAASAPALTRRRRRRRRPPPAHRAVAARDRRARATAWGRTARRWRSRSTSRGAGARAGGRLGRDDRRLRDHRPDRPPPPAAPPASRPEGAGHGDERGPRAPAPWHGGEHRRPGRRAPAAGHRQRRGVPPDRGRDRHREPDRPADGLRARPPDGAHRAARPRRGHARAPRRRRAARSTSSSVASSRSTRPTCGPSVPPRPSRTSRRSTSASASGSSRSSRSSRSPAAVRSRRSPTPGAARTGALAAVASPGRIGPTRDRRRAARTGAPSSGGVATSGAARYRRPGPGSGPTRRPRRLPGVGGGDDAVARRRSPGVGATGRRRIQRPASRRGTRWRADRSPVREHGGSEDFRAVAPPVMSFAQGRRR